MSLDAGKLRHRVLIQSRAENRDPVTGAIQYVWSTITNGVVWAAIEPLSTREFVAAAAVQSKVSARIIMRYRTDVTSAMRIVHNGVVYSIEGPPLRDKESGLEYMTLAVSQGVNLGA